MPYIVQPIAFSQTERLLKSQQLCTNECKAYEWAHQCRQEPRLTVYRVVLLSYSKTGYILQAFHLSLSQNYSSLECPIYAFSGTPIPIFNDECDGLLFLLTV